MQQVFDDEAKSALTGFTTFTAGANVFCIQPGPRGQLAPFQTLPSRDCVASFSLATVVNWDKESFAERDLEQVINDFSDLDDVWIPEFLTGENLHSKLPYEKAKYTSQWSFFE